MPRPLAFLLVFSALASTADAQVYRWVDEAGEVHYTDNQASIPAGKKKSAVKTQGQELGYVSSDRAGKSKGPPQAPHRADGEQEAVAAGANAAYEDSRERAALEAEALRERDWRGRFREAHARIERLEKLVAADQRALEDPINSGIPMLPPNHDGVILPNPEFEAIKQRLPEERQQLAQAREELADLEREASRDSVPQTWRR